MIGEIFVAQGQTVDALRQHGLHGMLDPLPTAIIREAGGETFEQTDPLVGLAKQQSAAVTGQRAAVEIGYHPLLEVGCKLEAGLGTLCHSQGRLLLSSKHLLIQMFMPD